MTVLFNPADRGFQKDPYPSYARLRSEAPVYRHPAGFHVISRHRDVVEVLKNVRVFSSKAMGGMDIAVAGPAADFNPTRGSLIGKDPPVHTRMRNIVNRGFTPRRIAEFEERIQRVADGLFAEFEHKGECDLVRQLAVPLPIMMIAELLGLDPSRYEDFKRWSDSLLSGTSGVPAPDDQRRHMANVREFTLTMREYTEQRRRDPGDDLVSLLIDAEEDQGILSADEVVGFVSLLLFAGSETTTNLIGNAVIALLENPDQLDRVRSDPSRVPQLVEEALRYDSPVQLLMRISNEESEVGGVPIAKNAFVLPLLASANRDDAVFPEADRFDIDRDTQGHLAFGFGNHFCLGAALARLQGRIALESVVQRLRGLRRASDRPLERHGSFLIRGPRSLPLQFDA